MDGPFELATTAALAEVLRLDPRLAAEWERLRRALADLVPSDERGGWLLALGAAAGVPALVERRHMAEAWARLSDLAACPADAVARGPRRPRPTGWSRSSRPARDGPARARRPGVDFHPLATDTPDALARSIAAVSAALSPAYQDSAYQDRARTTCLRLSSKSMILAWICWPVETTLACWLTRCGASLLTWMMPSTPFPRST